MSWQPYRIDDCARQVVLKALERDPTGESLSQVFKMRATCAYGLERFWGECLRLKQKATTLDQNKADIIIDTWKILSEDILSGTGIDLSFNFNINLNPRNSPDREALQAAARVYLQSLWQLQTGHPHQAQVALSVLTTFCEAIIWWKNRLAVNREC